MVKIYNTITRRKEEFVPIDKNEVKMYVCGPTVYNYIHLGNARPLVVFDTVRRYLEYKGYHVKYVQNFTDVDDKIINKAKELGKTAGEISETFIQEYYEDARELNVRDATVHPKVTENMDGIIQFINALMSRNVAYSKNGDVYFSTEQFHGYGKLSKQSVEDLVVGARVEVDENKKNPLDFALWKSAKPNEIAWNSPWGPGRPGWHIECSTMAKKYLGETIDIHAGGADLIFPHHENEIAQTESLTDKQFAKYWMHNGYININNEKMSKSLGNVFTVKDLIAKYDPIVIRLLILSVHYRNPINFSEELIDQSKTNVERIKTTYTNIHYRIETEKQSNSPDEELERVLQELKLKFDEEMDDDFNTANAITLVFEYVKKLNIYMQKESISTYSLNHAAKVLENWLEILGLEKLVVKEEQVSNTDDGWIEDLIEQRAQAKKDKNWKLADEIRDSLTQKGIILEDTPQGVRWRKL